MDKMTILDTIKSLPEVGMHRTRLYLNVERVKDQYYQNGGLDTIEMNDELNSGITAGIQAFLASIGSTISTRRGSSGQLTIHPLLMAILLEEEKRRSNLLLDPASVDFIPRGAFLKHVADTHLIQPSEIVTTQTCGLPEHVARAVQVERERQMKVYEDLGFSIKTSVWATANKRNLAAIVSTQFVDPNSFTSYAQGLTGILGLLEKETPHVRFIAPLWIWHEGFRES